jgi:hypothetical protein
MIDVMALAGTPKPFSSLTLSVAAATRDMKLLEDFRLRRFDRQNFKNLIPIETFTTLPNNSSFHNISPHPYR